jgi:HD-like signal output (HDOD) protein
MTARHLWSRFGSDPAISADDLYVAGLLHDTGLLVLEQFFPDEFSGVLTTRAASGGRLWQTEEEELGMDHGAVGGLLLGRWSLPPHVAEGVTNHHHPHHAEARYQQVSRVVQAAEVLCTEYGAALVDEGQADYSPEDVLTELGLDESDIAAVIAEVPKLAERAGQFLA